MLTIEWPLLLAILAMLLLLLFVCIRYGRSCPSTEIGGAVVMLVSTIVILTIFLLFGLQRPGDLRATMVAEQSSMVVLKGYYGQVWIVDKPIPSSLRYDWPPGFYGINFHWVEIRNPGFLPVMLAADHTVLLCDPSRRGNQRRIDGTKAALPSMPAGDSLWWRWDPTERIEKGHFEVVPRDPQGHRSLSQNTLGLGCFSFI